ncbi:MAG: Dihydrofolate reductase homolog, partial [uncultured Thermoleophilia bacterium]
EQRHLPDLDVTRRLRGRTEPESGEPDWRGRDAPARMGARHRELAPPARVGGRRAKRRLRRGRPGDEKRGRLRHGPADVRRRRGAVGRDVAGVVGRGAALPRAGLRAHPPRARAADHGGRHDVHVRHRRRGVGGRAGPDGGRGEGRLRSGRGERRAADARGGAPRRAPPPHRARAARSGGASARERRRPDARAGRGDRLTRGDARPVPRRPL